MSIKAKESTAITDESACLLLAVQGLNIRALHYLAQNVVMLKLRRDAS